MATVIRPEISHKNKYWIDKHRYYELKHFCLQYPMWKENITDIYNSVRVTSVFKQTAFDGPPKDSVSDIVIMKVNYESKISLLEDIARETDKYLYNYILKAVTEGLSYTYLKTRLEIPCSRGLYYDRYRRFFWLLDKERD